MQRRSASRRDRKRPHVRREEVLHDSVEQILQEGAYSREPWLTEVRSLVAAGVGQKNAGHASCMERRARGTWRRMLQPQGPFLIDGACQRVIDEAQVGRCMMAPCGLLRTPTQGVPCGA